MRKITFILSLLSLISLSGCGNPYDLKDEDLVYYSVGDSITWQDGNNYLNTDQKAIGYQTIVKEKLSFTDVANKSLAGAGSAKTEKASVVYDNDFRDVKYADVITIFIGTNDFKLNVPLGKLSDKDSKDFNDETFYGSYQDLLRIFEEKGSNASIYLITPLQRDNEGYDINSTNPAGHKLIDYVNAVKNIGELYDIPVIDLYSESELNIRTLDKYTLDGLHPNDEGYKVIADEIIKTIQEDGNLAGNN